MSLNKRSNLRKSRLAGPQAGWPCGKGNVAPETHKAGAGGRLVSDHEGLRFAV